MIETPEEFANAVIFEWRNDRQDPPRFLRQVIAENTTARDAAIRTECAERAEDCLRRQWCRWTYSGLRAAIMAEPKEGV